MTDVGRLRAAAQAAGLRFSDEDLKALLPAWKRYGRLVRALEAALAEDAERFEP